MRTNKIRPWIAPGYEDTSKAELPEEVASNLVVTEAAGQGVSIAISIVSNSSLLREGLLALLSPHFNLQLIATYPGNFHIISRLPNPPGHIVLVDSNIGPETALACITYWRKLTPPADVLVLEIVDDIDVIMAYIEAGAGGYTLLGASSAEVVVAIQRLRDGVAYSSPEVTASLFRLAARRPTQPGASPLTSRELDVLREIAKGYRNKKIASNLFIEVRTVKQHVHNILRKLHLHKRGDAVRFAFEQGWLNTDPPTDSNSC